MEGGRKDRAVCIMSFQIALEKIATLTQESMARVRSLRTQSPPLEADELAYQETLAGMDLCKGNAFAWGEQGEFEETARDLVNIPALYRGLAKKLGVKLSDSRDSNGFFEYVGYVSDGNRTRLEKVAELYRKTLVDFEREFVEQSSGGGA